VWLSVALALACGEQSAGSPRDGSAADAAVDDAGTIVEEPPPTHPDGPLGPDAWGAPGCGCEPGEYWVEVIGDQDDQLFAFPVPMQNCEDDPIRVPWCSSQSGELEQVAACSTAGAARSCIASSGLGVQSWNYIDRAGQEWHLERNSLRLEEGWESLAPGGTVVGEYDASAFDGNGSEVMRLTGSFRLCYAHDWEFL
jgi:hypothetical protein